MAIRYLDLQEKDGEKTRHKCLRGVESIASQKQVKELRDLAYDIVHCYQASPEIMAGLLELHGSEDSQLQATIRGIEDEVEASKCVCKKWKDEER